MSRRERKILPPHVGKEPPKPGAPTVSEPIIAAFLAVLFVGCAIYAEVVGGFGWAIAVILGFLGLISASMAIEQTREFITVRRAESVASVDPPNQWPTIGTSDKR